MHGPTGNANSPCVHAAELWCNTLPICGDRPDVFDTAALQVLTSMVDVDTPDKITLLASTTRSATPSYREQRTIHTDISPLVVRVDFDRLDNYFTGTGMTGWVGEVVDCAADFTLCLIVIFVVDGAV